MAAESNTSLLNHHKEKHFTAGEIVRDIIIGVSDGLTVPFALAAGLSGANATSPIILTAGVAEIAAGAISMGLGGYIYSLHLHMRMFLQYQPRVIVDLYILIDEKHQTPCEYLRMVVTYTRVVE